MRRIVLTALIILAASAALAAPTEWWLFAAQLDSGDRVLIEVTLTDVGPGERNAAAIGRWVQKDGTLVEFSRAKLGGEWTESAGGRRMDLQKFVLDRSAARAQLRVDKGSLKLALDFALAEKPLATRKLAGRKWTHELWAGANPVNASLWKKGMSAPIVTKGRIGVSHRLITGPEGKLAARRLESFALDREPLYVLEVARGARAERWVVALDARGRVASQDFAEAASAEKLSAPSPKLALPGPAVTGALSAGTRLAAYDPLADLPAPIRFVLGLRLRSAWMASPLESVVGGNSRKRTAIASYTFYAG
ncbi:MAG: hypothetical protein FJ091_21055 [Deltaproteobacteria bacterium]|nr:hypothetical protein [Deltaproteobacteria bacterium]